MNGHKLLKESGLLAKYKIDERVIPTRKQRRAVLRYLNLLERQINVGALQKKALGQLSRVYSGYRWFQKLSLNLSFAAVLGLLQGQFANADEVLSSSVNRQLTAQTHDYIQAKAATDFTSAAPTQAVSQAKRSVQSLHLLANQSVDESYQQSLASLNNEEFFVADNSILTVIDPGVDDWEVIADAVRAGDILVLNQDAPPLQQIIDKLKAMGQVKVLNIISHGNDGEIYLADERVSLANLQSHQQALTELGSLLAADGQMLLFGCDLAKSEIGKAFVEKLADLTGADVAGSVNVTGSGLLASNTESDWELEYFTGKSSPSVAQTFNTKRLLAYSNVLQTVYTFSGNSSCNADDFSPPYLSECNSTIEDLNLYAQSLDCQVSAQEINGVLALDGCGVGTSGVPRFFELSKTNASNYTPNSMKVNIWTYRTGAGTQPYDDIFEIFAYDQNNTQVGYIKYDAVYDSDTINVNFANPAASVYTRNNGYFNNAPTLTTSGSFTGVHKLRFKINANTFSIDDLSVGALVVNAAPVNNVLPAISGTTATVGNSLAGSNGSWTDTDGDTLTYSRQWYRADDANGTNWVAIASATHPIYTLTTSDAHKYIQLVVTANDGNGGIQIANSTYTQVANTAPVNSALPSISGTATVGNVLSTTNGTWIDADGDGRTYSYQWYRADDNSGTNLAMIAGANSASYTLTTSDAHKYLRVVVTANDGNGGTPTATSAYSAMINTVPTDITLSNASVGQSGGTNATVGTLSSTDPDIGETFTYTLVAGTGSTNNSSFNISGSTLRANDSAALTAGSYSVRIRTTDNAAGWFEKAFTVTVTDDLAPVITAVSIPNSVHKVGDSVTATITVSSDPDNYTTGLGGISGTINGYALGSLTRQSATSYTATFTVTDNGTNRAAGSNIPVSLTLKDSTGNTSALYNAAISQNSDAIFANLPEVRLSASSNSIDENAGSSTLTASLSRSMSNQWPAAITVNLAYSGTATAGTDYNKSDSITINANSSTGTASVTAIDDNIYDAAADETVIVDIDTVSVGTVDSPSQQSITIEDNETAPVVTLSVGSSAVAENGGTSSITASLNHATYEDVVVSLGYSGTATIAVDYNTPSGSITIAAGALTANAAVGIEASDDNDEEGAESILIDITNVSGGGASANGNQQQSVSITDDDDETSPVISTVTIPNVPMKVGDSVTAIITVAADTDILTLVSGSIAGINLASVSKINDTTYTASFTIPEAGTDFAAGADLPVSLVLKDSANNNSLAFTDAISQNADAIDANRPTISVLTRQAPTSQYTNEDSLTFQVTFTEAVTGVDAADFMVNGTTATISSLTTSDNLNYLLTLTGGDLAELNAVVYLQMAAGYSIVDIATNSMTSPVANTYINNSESFTVDNTASAAPLDLGLELASDCGISNSDRITNDNTPTVLGKLPDFGYRIASVELFDANNVSLGSTLSHICGAWGITSSTLVDGTHSLTAKATDTAGNVSVASTPLVVVIDTVVATSGAPDLADTSDTGISNSDNLTTNTTPTFGGTVEPNSKVTVSSSVAGVLGNATANGSGVWSYTAVTALAAGVHNISIVEEDVAGNASAASALLELTIDSTAPQISTNVPASGSTPGATSVVFEVNFDDTVHNISTTDFTLTTVGTAGSVSAVSVTSGSSVNVTVSSLTGDGTIRLDHVTSDITDAAGNILAAYSAGTAHTVDRVAPNLTAVDFTQAAVDMGNQNNLSVAVAFAGTETAALGANYTISSSGGGTPVTGSGTINATGDSISGLNVISLPDGTLTISLTLTDEHGNVSTAVTDTIVKDANAPVVSNVAITDGRYKTGETVSFMLTFSEALVLSGSNSDYVLAIDVGGTSRQAVLTGHAGAVLTFSYTVQAGEDTSTAGVAVLTDGLSLLNGATIKDAGNNPATITFSGVDNPNAQVDTTAPVATVVTDPAQAVFVNSANYEIKGTHSEIGVSVNLYTDTGNDGTADDGVLASAVVDADGNWSIPNVTLTADTEHNYVVIAEDAAGNESIAVDVPTITEDSIAPVAAAVTAPVIAVSVNTSTQLIEGTHSEDGVTVELFADSNNDGVADNSTVLASAEVGIVTTGIWSFNAPLTTNTENNFVVIAKDKAGNVSTAVDVVTITQDAVAPVVTVTALTTADSTPGLTGTVDDVTATLSLTVDGQTLTPTNNGNGSWTLADNLIAALDHGPYDVAISATDAQGNIGTDASSNELTVDLLPPSGYSATIVQDIINASNQAAMSFVFAGAEVGSVYNYSVSDGTNSVTGSGTVSSATQQVGAINVTALAETTLQLSVTLTDSVGNTGSTVTDTVLKRYNTTPVISGTPATSANAGSPYSFTPNATDADAGTTLTFSIANKPGWASFNTATGALTGIPTNANVGTTAGIVISVNDGTATAALPAFALTVVRVNNAPVVTNRSATTVEDTPLSLTLTAQDPDQDQLSYEIVSQPAQGTATIQGSLLVYTPNKDFNGSDSIEFVANDAESSSAAATISLTVTPVNDNPQIEDDSYSLQRVDTNQYQLAVLANDSDVDGDTLTIDGASTSVGTVVFNAQGLTLTTPDRYVGPVSLRYTVTDGKGGRDTADVNLIIEGGAASNLPVITVPADIEVNATALFTRVPLGTATAVDRNGRRLRVSLINGSLFFAPGEHIVYWQATDADGNTATKAQRVRVNPLVSLSKDQLVTEGSEVEVQVILNGPAPVYPVSVPYTVSGSAGANDHTLVSGVAEISSGLSTTIRFSVLEDALADSPEDIIITLDSSVNRGSKRSSRIVVSEANVAPVVSLTVQQNGENRLTISESGGVVTVTATVTDANPQDQITGVWDFGRLTNVTSDQTQFSFDPTEQGPGLYLVSYTATDNGTPNLSATSRVFIVLRPNLPTLGSDDTDGDLVPDDQEGFADSDGDGIPDYQDAMNECNVMPTELLGQTQFVAEGEPGVCLRLGTVAAETEAGGLQIAKDAVELDNVAVNIGGIFDFIAYGLPEQGKSYSLVIPQRLPVPANAVYRKFSDVTGWVDFVSNERNSVSSTAGERGFCPPPGDAAWTEGLTEGHWCVQVTVEDGGPNDADGIANSAIVDPGGVAVVLNGNNLPVAEADEASVLVDTSVDVNVLANDTDVDGDTLTVSQAISSFGTVTILPDQQLSYTPNPDFVGVDTVIYSITDGKGGTASSELVVNVFSNTAPVAVNDSAFTDDRTAILIAVLTNDTDAEGDVLTVTAASAEEGTVSIEADQRLRYTPKAGFDGVDTISYTVTDSSGDSATGSVSVTVRAYQDVVVDNKSSGGSMTWWMGMVLAGAVMLRRRSVLGAAAVALLAFSPWSQGQDWYLQGSVGHSTADQKQNRLVEELPSGTITAFDDSDSLYGITLGYQLHPYFAVEMGYQDLGEASAQLSGDSLTPEQYHELVKAVSPVLVDGWTAAARFTLWQSDMWNVEVPVGLFRWDSEIESSRGNSTLYSKTNGTDWFLGVQLNYSLSDDLKFGLGYQQLELDANDVSSWLLSVRYEF